MDWTNLVVTAATTLVTTFVGALIGAKAGASKAFELEESRLETERRETRSSRLAYARFLLERQHSTLKALEDYYTSEVFKNRLESSNPQLVLIDETDPFVDLDNIGFLTECNETSTLNSIHIAQKGYITALKWSTEYNDSALLVARHPERPVSPWNEKLIRAAKHLMCTGVESALFQLEDALRRLNYVIEQPDA